MFKVIIFGSRDFKDKELLFSKCDYYLKDIKDEIVIVSGMQKSYCKSSDTYYGADYLGCLYAKERNYKIEEYPAPWEGLPDTPKSQMKKNSKSKWYWPGAGHYRNSVMEKVADAGIGFPVKGSKNKGTNNMMALLEKNNKPVKIV